MSAVSDLTLIAGALIEVVGAHAFVDGDAGYHAWLRAWPKGFVLNCNREPSPGCLVLHRATCNFTGDLGPSMATFTGDYIKVCSTDRTAVRQWAHDNADAAGASCQRRL